MPPNGTLKPREFVIALSSAATGGFVGTMVRDLLTGLEHLPTLAAKSFTISGHNTPPTNLVTWPHEIPWVLLAINFVGVFLATRLLRGPLRHRDPNDRLRVLIVTGFFGGLTSYSGLFVDFAAIWHLSPQGCLFVAVGAILSGVLAGWLGLLGLST
jgi:fluoride exporter